MMAELPEKTWIETLSSGSALATILVALIGQAGVSVLFQIRNNEQQEAAIEANKVALSTLRYEIVNLQTPLSSMVLRMDGRLSGLEVEHKDLSARLQTADATISTKVETIDRTGTRAMEVVSEAVKRIQTQLDRLVERINSTDQRVNDVQMRGVLTLQNQIDLVNQSIKRLDEQQNRILQAIDNQYNMLNEFIRQYSFKPIPPGPTPGTKPK